MSAGVVDNLELVEVHKTQCVLTAVLPCQLDQSFGTAFELVSIVQPGQRIVARLEANSGLVAFRLLATRRLGSLEASGADHQQQIEDRRAAKHADHDLPLGALHSRVQFGDIRADLEHGLEFAGVIVDTEMGSHHADVSMRCSGGFDLLGKGNIAGHLAVHRPL